MKIHVWCGKHNVPLSNVGDGGPFLVPIHSTDTPRELDPRVDARTPSTGVWGVDTSDMACLVELQSGIDPETDEYRETCVDFWTMRVLSDDEEEELSRG
jgi:hypothetical protein